MKSKFQNNDDLEDEDEEESEIQKPVEIIKINLPTVSSLDLK